MSQEVDVAKESHITPPVGCRFTQGQIGSILLYWYSTSENRSKHRFCGKGHSGRENSSLNEVALEGASYSKKPEHKVVRKPSTQMGKCQKSKRPSKT